MAKTILPGLANTATFVINIAPMLTQKGPWYQDDLTDFFSETTQMDLLRPLATMRGIKDVEIHGLVAPEMATELKDLMMSGKWNDPRSVIDFMKETKDYGAQFYREGLLMEAFSTWRSSMHEIDRLREGITWEKLIKIGGEPWIDQIAALQCSLGLNSALAMIKIWGLDPKNVAMPLEARKVHRNLALVSLTASIVCSSRILERGIYRGMSPNAPGKDLVPRSCVHATLGREMGSCQRSGTRPRSYVTCTEQPRRPQGGGSHRDVGT